MPTGNSYLTRLPENKKLTDRLKKTSIILSVFIGIVSSISLIGLLINSSPLNSVFLGSFGIAMFTILAFIFSVIVLLLEDAINSSKDSNPKYLHTIYFVISFLVSALILIIGWLYLSNYFFNNNYYSFFLDSGKYTKETILTSGVCILLIGFAFLFARIKIKYHFFIVHLLALIVLMISSLNIMDILYQAFSPLRLQFTYLPLNIAVLFMLLSIAIAFRWPSKGFIGIFTTEAVSTIFTLRLLFINIFIIAALGLVSLAGAKLRLYSSFESVAVFAVLVMLTATILAWVNSKLLYKFELERYIMREELKAHNIALKTSNEALSGEMTELKKTNEEYIGKLSYRERLNDIIENSE